jgi:HlyD family secretion protein
LKPGMTSTVSIETARADDVLRVPAAALRFVPTESVWKEFGGPAADESMASETSPDASAPASLRGGRREQAIWQLNNGRLLRIPVRSGVSDGTQVEVLGDALVEGASIITGVARSDQAEAAAPVSSGSPLVPQMPRRPGANGGGARQGRQGS